MDKKKSQLSIILIMGLALLIVVSIVLYSARSTLSKKTSIEASQTLTASQDVRPITQHINACVDSLSAQALSLLGSQGGYIYASQGGGYPDPPDFREGSTFLPFEQHKISYGIRRNRASLPDYPSHFAPYGPDQEGPSSSGSISLSPLNGSGSSWTFQIEQFVISQIDNCIAGAGFEEQGYSFEKQDKAAQAFLGPDEVSTTLHSPMQIVNDITKESTSIDTIYSSHSIRLLSLHTELNSLLSSDAQDILFNISAQRELPQGMSIRIYPNVYGQDDLIEILDTGSLLLGKPYSILSARQNRNPALHYLSRSEDFAYLSPSRTTLNFSHKTNISIDLLEAYLGAPFADDPDEDGINFTFFVESSALNPKPRLPQLLDTPRMTIRIEASDGQLTDYQLIEIERNPFAQSS